MKQLLLISFISLLCSYYSYSQKSNNVYESNKLFIKYKNDFFKSSNQNNKLDLNIFFNKNEINKFSLNSIKRPFYEIYYDNLNLVYELNFYKNININELIEYLNSTNSYEYIERIPIYRHSFIPNDLLNATGSPNQWYLHKIFAQNAWDSTSGSSNITIAIVDDAIDINHLDLANSIWINTNEIPNNNFDDDGNGYIDDVNGYDVADNDNNPNPPNSSMTHGTHVAGIAGASTNNGIGIASIGNGISIMPVKSNCNTCGNTVISDAIYGLLYAARTKANIINCSWGGNGYSSTFQSLINWAHNEQKCLIVAAAGNDNSSTNHYPSAYNNVIAVSATNSNDIKASFSNFGNWVDVSSPGTAIYSTIPFSNYISYNGTSMACPLVAGLCGLIWSANENLFNTQIENCIINSTDNIDSVNSSYIGKLGTGRINALKAIQCVKYYDTMIPTADFDIFKTNICFNQSIDISNNSQFADSVEWIITGPYNYYSNEFSPNNIINISGNYLFKLIAYNMNGSDSISKLYSIIVDSNYFCPINLGPNKNHSIQKDCWGKLFDSGGENNNYFNYDYSSITLSPDNADSILLIFHLFDVEEEINCEFDHLNVYDGINSSAPLIGTFCNTYPPPDSLITSGPNVFIEFIADPALELTGFDIEWNCISSTKPDFYADDYIVCDGSVSFHDISLNTPISWKWYFGNGDSSIIQNPVYHYNDSGFYTVTLITENNLGYDTVQKINYIYNLNKYYLSDTFANICFGDSLFYRNNYFTKDTIFYEYFQNVNYCDSIYKLTLIVKPLYNTQLYDTICNGDSIHFGNQVLYNSGIYYDTLQSLFSCDSIIELSLIVKPLYNTKLYDTICNGDSIHFGNQVLYNSGIYYDTLQSLFSCDSIIELSLIVKSLYSTQLYDTICNGDSINFGNQVLYNSGIYYDTLQSFFSCDSIIELLLTLNPLYNTQLYDTICNGDSIHFGNQVLYNSGIYYDTLQSLFSCDSIFELSLIVKQLYSTQLYDTICNGDSMHFGNQVLYNSGIYYDTLQSLFSCDSIFELSLIVKQLYSTQLYDTICNGDSMHFGNQVLYNSGIYYDTLQSLFSCDSIIELSLIVNPLYSTQLYDTICNGDSIHFGNQVLYNSGIYYDTLQSLFSCDSIIELSLTLNPLYNTQIYDTICNGDSINFGNQVLYNSGIYYDNLQSLFSCDSIIELSLTLNPLYNTQIYDTICNGDSIHFGNQVLYNSGIYYDTLQSFFSCDSIIELLLTLNPLYNTQLYDTICNGDSINFGNQVLYNSGIYYDTLQSFFSCDSIIELLLTLNPLYSTQLYDTICNGDSIHFGNQVLYNSGIYYDTLQSFFSCDSIFELSLIVKQLYSTQLYDTICNGDSIHFGNQVLYNSGIYYDTLQSFFSCDSIIELLLTLNPLYNTQLYDTICNGDSIHFGNQVLYNSGIYYDTMQSIFSCDSIIELSLMVGNIIKPKIIIDENTLYVNDNYTKYEWYYNDYFFNDNSNIRIDNDGNYWLVVFDENNCKFISDTFNYRKYSNEIIQVFPNPIKDKFNIVGNKIVDYDLSMFDNLGNIIYFDKMTISFSNIEIHTEHLSNGIYYFRATKNEDLFTFIIIKNE